MPVDVKATTLITLAQARAWVHNDEAESTQDAVLVVCADAASERIERWTSRYFKQRTVTESIDTSVAGFGRALFTKRAPVISLTSIAVNGAALDAERYTLDTALGRVLLTSGMQFGDDTVALVYEAGYIDAELPSDAIEACLELTKRLYRMKTSGGGVFQTVNVGNSSFVVRDRVPDDMKDAIERLTDKRFG